MRQFLTLAAAIGLAIAAGCSGWIDKRVSQALHGAIGPAFEDYLFGDVTGEQIAIVIEPPDGDGRYAAFTLADQADRLAYVNDVFNNGDRPWATTWPKAIRSATLTDTLDFVRDAVRAADRSSLPIIVKYFADTRLGDVLMRLDVELDGAIVVKEILVDDRQGEVATGVEPLQAGAHARSARFDSPPPHSVHTSDSPVG